MPAMLERIHAPCGDRRRRPECPNSARRRAPPPRTGAADSREARRGWRGRATAGLLRCAARSGAPAPAGGWVSCRTRRRFDFALFPRAVPTAGSGVPARCPRRDRQRADGRRDRRRDAVQDQAADVFARRAATVAFGVNPPEQRPSVGERRHLAPAQRTAEQHGAMIARSGSAWVV